MNMNVNTKKLVMIAMFSAIASVLMIFDFPIPIAPGFMKIDLSDIPIIIGGFLMGPVSGVVIAILKILIKLILKTTSTVFVGETVNLIGSILYVVPASLVYKKFKSKKFAIIGLLIATLFSSIVITFIDSIFIFPFYMNLFEISEEGIIKICMSINPIIDNMTKVMLFSVFPFNFIKYFTVSIITIFLYKKISIFLKGI